MTDVYFPVTANYAQFGSYTALRGDVLFTPIGLPPIAGYAPAAIPGLVWGGVLFGSDGAPAVQLLAHEDLTYVVSFRNFPIAISSFAFAAPTDVTPVDLITVERVSH